MKTRILKQIARIDTLTLSKMQKINNKYLDLLMKVSTRLGNVGIVWIVISFYLIYSRKYRIIGRNVFIMLILSAIMGEGVIKHLFKRGRPFTKSNTRLIISKPATYSFPSGHAFSSFAAADMLSIYFSSYGIIFWTIAFLISISRIYLNVHYLSDVIAGCLLGILCAKMAFVLLNSELIKDIPYYLR